MATSYAEYKSRIVSLDSYETVIQEARTEYGITMATALSPYKGIEVPMNLEQEFFDALLDKGYVNDARRVLERMKYSYTNANSQNLIESFEYRLRLVEQTGKLIDEKMMHAKKEAKEELNQHTILLVAIIVGIITIFGAANELLHAESFQDAWLTFIGISFAVIMLVFVAFSVNYIFRNRK